MNQIKKLSFVVSLFVLATACGGGSNDDSSGAGSAPDNTVETGASGTGGNDEDADSPVTYTGSVNVVLTAPGFPPITETVPLTVVVDGSTVRLTVDGQTTTATLNGDSFSTSITITEGDDTLTCSGTANINGTVSGNTVSGTIGGTGNCTGEGIDAPLDLNGSFSATR